MKKLKTPPIPDDRSSTLIYRILRDYMRPRWKRIALAMSMMFVASGMTAAQAYLLEPIINKIFVQKMSGYLWPIGLAIIIVFILRGVASWINNVLMSYIGQDIIKTLQSQLFHSLIRQDMNYFQQSSSGKLSSLLISDVLVMRSALVGTMTGFGKSMLTLLFLTGLMFYQDWRMSLFAFVVFPPAGYMATKIGRKIRQVSRSTQEQYAILTGLLGQSFQGIRQVKAYNAEDFEDRRIDGTLNQITKLNNKSARVASLAIPMSELLSGIAIAIIIIYGGNQVIEGNNTAGGFLSFIAAFMLAYEPLKKLARLNAGVQIGLAAADRVFQAIDAVPHILDTPKAQPLLVKSPSITFDNVSFQYPDSTPALKNVSFHVEPGQKAALVGPSGSGKSTCLQLLLRFYDLEQGRILIDGQNIKDVTMESLRKAVSFVSQDVFIFDDTIRDNIIYAQTDFTEEALISAARQAAAHDFITQLEHGYDTRVGEMGTKLSGGQKQRVAIARALLKDASILLLDEATSALDNESEKLVTEGLGHLQEGRTTLVVAHRLSTIKDADQIIVMNNQQVVATGTHEVLMQQEGLYPILYDSMLS